MMKNMNVILAKKYIDNFYQVLRLSVDEKQLKEIRQKVDKFEDVLYIKEIINDDIKNNILKRYQENQKDNIERYQEMLVSLDQFYEENLKNDETISPKVTEHKIALLEKELLNMTREEYLHDIHALCELKNNLNVELKTFADKKKNDEYIDIASFNLRITNIFKEVKDTINVLIKDNEVEPEAYVEQYLEFVYHQYNVIFESSGNKNK